MTRGSELRSELLLAADKVARHNNELERSQNGLASDHAVLAERVEQLVANYSKELYEGNKRFCDNLAREFQKHAISVNKQLMETGLIPTSDVQSIAEKVTPVELPKTPQIVKVKES